MYIVYNMSNKPSQLPCMEHICAQYLDTTPQYNMQKTILSFAHLISRFVQAVNVEKNGKLQTILNFPAFKRNCPTLLAILPGIMPINVHDYFCGKTNFDKPTNNPNVHGCPSIIDSKPFSSPSYLLYTLPSKPFITCKRYQNVTMIKFDCGCSLIMLL